MKDQEGLSPSQECYLATILILELEKQCARSGEIAGKCGVHKSSVTAALRALAERSLIHYEPYGAVTLTPEGKDMATGIIGRCRVLRDFFVEILGIRAEDAQKAACQMQHSVPGTIITRISERFGNLRCGG